MEISVVNFGRSKGIELSNSILEKYSFGNTVEMILEKECIILKATQTPRKNWEDAFKKMHDAGDDVLLITDVFPDENAE